jgi:AhpD family alkylhydroperoxidase
VKQVRLEFGAFVDPVAMHAAVPHILAAAWCSLRESMLAGRVKRSLKESMAAVISQSNQCPFCVDAHTIMLHATGSAGPALALRRGEKNPFKDPQAQAFAEWASATGRAGHPALKRPPFDNQQAPEIIGTVFCMHYINRVAHALLNDTPVPPSFSPLKRLILWLSGYYFASAVRTRRRSGESLGLLPDVPLAGGLEWAQSAPAIQKAFSALVAAIEEASQAYLTSEAQQAILKAIQKWKGEAMPLGSQWIDGALKGLEEDCEPAARLALLAALASYRIDQDEVEAFRSRWPQDAALLAVLCWGSLQAARRLTSWVAEGFRKGSGT